jgi:hypothetical protein
VIDMPLVLNSHHALPGSRKSSGDDILNCGLMRRQTKSPAKWRPGVRFNGALGKGFGKCAAKLLTRRIPRFSITSVLPRRSNPLVLRNCRDQGRFGLQSTPRGVVSGALPASSALELQRVALPPNFAAIPQVMTAS